MKQQQLLSTQTGAVLIEQKQRINAMTKTQIQDFTQGNISKQLLTFAWPLFLSNLLQVVYNMVDMVIVGKVLGKTGC